MGLVVRKKKTQELAAERLMLHKKVAEVQTRVKIIQEEKNCSEGLCAEATGINLSKKVQVSRPKGQVDVTGVSNLDSQFQHI